MQADSTHDETSTDNIVIRDRSAARILGVALLLGLSVDVLFYGKALGISFLIFVLLLLGGLAALSRLEGVTPVSRNLWLVVPLLFFAAMVFVRANAFVTFLNVVFSLVLLGLVAHSYTAGRIEDLPLIGYPIALLHTLCLSAARTPSLIDTGIDVAAVRNRGGRNVGSVLLGLFLAVPIVFLFALLLSAADLVFARYVENLRELEFLADLMRFTWRGVIVLVAAWLVAGGLSLALGWERGRQNEEAEEADGTETPSEDKPAGVAFIAALTRVFTLGFVEAATILVAVDLLFLLFVWIQFTYLFGGEANISTAGFTYAEYARRGFFELVTVAVLTLGLVLGLHALTRRESASRTRWFNVLGSLMVGCVLVMLASAFKRLLLYEEAYGYTQLRLYSHVFMVWLSATFAWFAAILWARPNRFAIGTFVCALGFLVSLNVINPDAFIARQNLERFFSKLADETAARAELDARYLLHLSDDAVPVLVANLVGVPEDEQKVLKGHLSNRLHRLEASDRWRAWPSYHLARYRAYDLLRRTLPPQTSAESR